MASASNFSLCSLNGSCHQSIGFNELPIRAVLLPKFEACIFLGNSMVRAPARHEFSEGRCRFHLEGSHLLSIGTICYHLFQSARAMWVIIIPDKQRSSLMTYSFTGSLWRHPQVSWKEISEWPTANVSAGSKIINIFLLQLFQSPRWEQKKHIFCDKAVP